MEKIVKVYEVVPLRFHFATTSNTLIFIVWEFRKIHIIEVNKYQIFVIRLEIKSHKVE